MHIAVRNVAKRPDVLETLAELDYDQDDFGTNDAGLTPLHVAAQMHSLQALRIILDAHNTSSDTSTAWQSDIGHTHESDLFNGFYTIHCAAGKFCTRPQALALSQSLHFGMREPCAPVLMYSLLFVLLLLRRQRPALPQHLRSGIS